MAIIPLDIIPPFPEIVEFPEVEEGLDGLPDVWSDHDIKTVKDSTDNYQTLPVESNPSNPYAGAIGGSFLLPDMLYDATINDQDPESVVDEYAPQF